MLNTLSRRKQLPGAATLQVWQADRSCLPYPLSLVDALLACRVSIVGERAGAAGDFGGQTGCITGRLDSIITGEFKTKPGLVRACY